jgi:hypothetical protein
VPDYRGFRPGLLERAQQAQQAAGARDFQAAGRARGGRS